MLSRSHNSIHKPSPDSPEFIQAHREALQALEAFKAEHKSTPFTKGDILIESGSSNTLVGLVVSGLVKAEGFLLAIPGADPKDIAKLGIQETTLFIAGPDNWVGLETFFSSPNALRYVALSDGSAILLPRDEMLEIMKLPLLYGAFQQCANQMQRFARDLSHRRSHLGVRVVSQLTRLRNWISASMPISLKEIAELSGSNHSRVSPIMAELERRGFVARSYRYYYLTEKFQDFPAVWEAVLSIVEQEQE